MMSFVHVCQSLNLISFTRTEVHLVMGAKHTQLAKKKKHTDAKKHKDNTAAIIHNTPFLYTLMRSDSDLKIGTGPFTH